MSSHLTAGERYGNVVVGKSWLNFGMPPLPKPDSKVNGIAVIDNVASLREHLQLALMVELSTIPLYLYATYGTDTTKDTVGTVDLITGIAIQEMLHVTLVGNCLKAVGGAPTLYPRQGVVEHWPAFPMDMAGHADHLRLNLRKPDLQQLITFLRIELPEAAGLAPESDGYDTLGQFYQAVMAAIKDLLPTVPNLFDPLSQSYQFTNDEVYYGQSPADEVIVIKDQSTADQALTIIVDQGEGSPGSEMDNQQLAHFYKFLSLFKPPFPATLNMPDNPRTPDYKDAKIKAVSTVFDASYCFFLLSVERLWTLSRELNGTERTAILNKNFSIMSQVLKPIAKFLVTQTDAAYPGMVAAPTWNYYQFQGTQPLSETLGLVKAAQTLYGASVPAPLVQAFAQLANCTEVVLDWRL